MRCALMARSFKEPKFKLNENRPRTRHVTSAVNQDTLPSTVVRRLAEIVSVTNATSLDIFPVTALGKWIPVKHTENVVALQGAAPAATRAAAPNEAAVAAQRSLTDDTVPKKIAATMTKNTVRSAEETTAGKTATETNAVGKTVIVRNAVENAMTATVKSAVEKNAESADTRKKK